MAYCLAPVSISEGKNCLYLIICFSVL
ncbi:hypothetical protein CUMW_073000 [Citrus unshiu]|nr:hypothetical protein CUMW_073000 [Citrus unshiu]